VELLYTPNSPYSRIVRVRILLQALNVALRPVSVRDSADVLLEYNPAGKVPSLKLDDGQVLSETRLICEYFDWLQPSEFLAPFADITQQSAI
jgi:glutathione S-transferase